MKGGFTDSFLVMGFVRPVGREEHKAVGRAHSFPPSSALQLLCSLTPPVLPDGLRASWYNVAPVVPLCPGGIFLKRCQMMLGASWSSFLSNVLKAFWWPPPDMLGTSLGICLPDVLPIYHRTPPAVLGTSLGAFLPDVVPIGQKNIPPDVLVDTYNPAGEFQCLICHLFSIPCSQPATTFLKLYLTWAEVHWYLHSLVITNTSVISGREWWRPYGFAFK